MSMGARGTGPQHLNLGALAPREEHLEQLLPIEMGERPTFPRENLSRQKRNSVEALSRNDNPSLPASLAHETFGADGMGTGTVSVLESLDILGVPDTDMQPIQPQQPSRVPASLYSIWLDDRSMTTAVGPVSVVPIAGPSHQVGADFSSDPRMRSMIVPSAADRSLKQLQEAMVQHVDRERESGLEESQWDPSALEAQSGLSGFPAEDSAHVLPDKFNPMDAETFGTDADQWESTWNATHPYGYKYE